MRRVMYILLFISIMMSCVARRGYVTKAVATYVGEKQVEQRDTSCDMVSMGEQEQTRMVIDVVRRLTDMESDTMPLRDRECWHIEAEVLRNRRRNDTTHTLHMSTIILQHDDTAHVEQERVVAVRNTHRPWAVYAMIVVLSIIVVGLVIRH